MIIMKQSRITPETLDHLRALLEYHLGPAVKNERDLVSEYGLSFNFQWEFATWRVRGDGDRLLIYPTMKHPGYLMVRGFTKHMLHVCYFLTSGLTREDREACSPEGAAHLILKDIASMDTDIAYHGTYVVTELSPYAFKKQCN